MFLTREDVLQRTGTVAYDSGCMTVIMRFDTSTKKRGRTSFGLIGCERSGKYNMQERFSMNGD